MSNNILEKFKKVDYKTLGKILLIVSTVIGLIICIVLLIMYFTSFKQVDSKIISVKPGYEFVGIGNKNNTLVYEIEVINTYNKKIEYITLKKYYKNPIYIIIEKPGDKIILHYNLLFKNYGYLFHSPNRIKVKAIK